jgi:hypothetical protein
MKKKVVFFALICLFFISCTPLKYGMTNNQITYKTMLQLKLDYKMSKKDCRNVWRAYFDNAIPNCSYNAGIGEVLFPDNNYKGFVYVKKAKITKPIN